MANNCPACNANLDLVGKAHRCIAGTAEVITVQETARIESGTYKYRDADTRRAYMRDYMRKRRNG